MFCRHQHTQTRTFCKQVTELESTEERVRFGKMIGCSLPEGLGLMDETELAEALLEYDSMEEEWLNDDMDRSGVPHRYALENTC